MNKYLAIFSLFIFASSCTDQCKINYEISLEENFSGVVKESYFHEGEHGTPTIILSTGKKYYVSSKGLICEAQAGDSLTKKSGTSEYILKRDGSEFVFYTDCGNREYMDSGKTMPSRYALIDCDKYK